MKKILFFILFAFVLSGCSLGLTAKDKLDIADGIGQVHEDGVIPDTWISENGIPIEIKQENFGKRADGNYCMTASVMVGNEQYMPPTPLCNIKGEWKKVAKTEPLSSPKQNVFVPKIVEVKSIIVTVKKTEALSIKKQKTIKVVETKIQPALPRAQKRSVVHSRKLVTESEFPLSPGTADKILHSRGNIKFTEIK